MSIFAFLAFDTDRKMCERVAIDAKLTVSFAADPHLITLRWGSVVPDIEVGSNRRSYPTLGVKL